MNTSSTCSKSLSHRRTFRATPVKGHNESVNPLAPFLRLQAVSYESNPRSVHARSLIDSGASAVFMDKFFAEQHDILSYDLPHPMLLEVIDGRRLAPIARKTALHHVWLGDIHFTTNVLFVDSPHIPILLGMSWLKQINPEIDWFRGKIRPSSQMLPTSSAWVLKPKAQVNVTEKSIDSSSKINIALVSPLRKSTPQLLPKQASSNTEPPEQEPLPPGVRLPSKYSEFAEVFEKRAAFLNNDVHSIW
jgi:predicted aspartyl protease